jgi:hypothetical protein
MLFFKVILFCLAEVIKHKVPSLDDFFKIFYADEEMKISDKSCWVFTGK